MKGVASAASSARDATNVSSGLGEGAGAATVVSPTGGSTAVGASAKTTPERVLPSVWMKSTVSKSLTDFAGGPLRVLLVPQSALVGGKEVAWMNCETLRVTALPTRMTDGMYVDTTKMGTRAPATTASKSVRTQTKAPT